MPIYELDGIRPELPGEGNYYLAPDVVIIGKVRLKRDASIWFGSVLRGDSDWIELGEGSNIQEHCTLHTDPGLLLQIGPRCTIGHKVMLHGCTIGENSLIGMGAIVLNNAKIGKNSMVGAGSLVTEGKEFPDNVLIMGSPARVIRPIDERHAGRITQAAEHYVERGRQFAKGLKQIG